MATAQGLRTSTDVGETGSETPILITIAMWMDAIQPPSHPRQGRGYTFWSMVPPPPPPEAGLGAVSSSVAGLTMASTSARISSSACITGGGRTALDGPAAGGGGHPHPCVQCSCFWCRLSPLLALLSASALLSVLVEVAGAWRV